MSITERIDNITRIPAIRLATEIPPPESVKIELSPRCNYRCGFCGLVQRDKQPTHDMDLDFFKRITSEMRECGVKEIGLFYLGESFMNVPLLVAAAEHCRELGFEKRFITTNGSLVTQEAAYQVMEAGITSIKFSINSADPDMFKEIIGVSSKNFWRALENVKGAWEVREASGFYDTELSASSIKYDDEQQPKMEAILAKYVRPYVDVHYWLPLYSMGAYATAREAELGYRPSAGNQGRLDNPVDPLPCWAPFTEGHVRAEGGLSACCFDAHGTWEMANLNDMSFLDAWNCEAFKELRAIHLRKDVTGSICEKCVLY